MDKYKQNATVAKAKKFRELNTPRNLEASIPIVDSNFFWKV
jgi:hypothetical protein